MGSWILMLDRRHGRALEFLRTPNGRPHLTCHGEFVAETDQDDDPQRLSPRNERKGMSATDHQGRDDERLRRFARDAAHWITDVVGEHVPERATLFCPAHLVGWVRKALDDRVLARLDVQQADLMHLTDADVLTHPAVSPLLEPSDVR